MGSPFNTSDNGDPYYLQRIVDCFGYNPDKCHNYRHPQTELGAIIMSTRLRPNDFPNAYRGDFMAIVIQGP